MKTASVVVLVLIAGAACAPRRQVVVGECRAWNGADVCGWGETLGDSLVSFGATIPMKAIDQSPAEMTMAWPPVASALVPLPGAVASATGFKSLTIFWEPHGHPPGPYLTPHYDFHFNTMTGAEIDSITCADSTKPPQLPAAYVLPDAALPQVGMLIGLCVPKMGMHALPAAEMTGTAPFQKTIVVGYYHRAPMFVEPMIARATLLGKQPFSIDVPDVPGRPVTTRYPSRFRAEYDSTAQSYRFVFEGIGAGSK